MKSHLFLCFSTFCIYFHNLSYEICALVLVSIVQLVYIYLLYDCCKLFSRLVHILMIIKSLNNLKCPSSITYFTLNYYYYLSLFSHKKPISYEFKFNENVKFSQGIWYIIIILSTAPFKIYNSSILIISIPNLLCLRIYSGWFRKLYIYKLRTIWLTIWNFINFDPADLKSIHPYNQTQNL